MYDDSKVAPQQPQQQVLAIANCPCDDKISDLENEKKDISLWPTSGAAKFERYDEKQLLEN